MFLLKFVSSCQFTWNSSANIYWNAKKQDGFFQVWYSMTELS